MMRDRQSRGAPRRREFASGSTDLDSNAQISCRDNRRIHTRAMVLTVEQFFQFRLQILGSIVVFGGFECIHCRPVKSSEDIQELVGRAWKLEGVGIFGKGNVLAGYSCA